MFLHLPRPRLRAEYQVLLATHRNDSQLRFFQERLILLALLPLAQWQPIAAEHEMRVVTHTLWFILAHTQREIFRSLGHGEQASVTDMRLSRRHELVIVHERVGEYCACAR